MFGGIKTYVFILVKLIGVIKLLEAFADDGLVARIGGADEVVGGDAEFFDECLPVIGQFVAVGLGILTGGLGGLLYFLAVLIKAGEVKRLLAKAPPRARGMLR